MAKHRAAYVAVVDSDQHLHGLFSYFILLKNLLPVSVAMSDGIQLDVKIQAAPGIAKRLRKVGPLSVSELIDRKPRVVHPETPTWEGISYIITHGDPLCVIDPDSQKFIGLITYESAVRELERLRDSGA